MIVLSAGVVLLVDANQGVQAQTVSNFYLAFANDLQLIAAMNKIDLPGADPERVREQIFTLFELDPSEVLAVSAKLGTGVRDLLDAVVTVSIRQYSISLQPLTPESPSTLHCWYRLQPQTIPLRQLVGQVPRQYQPRPGRGRRAQRTQDERGGVQQDWEGV